MHHATITLVAALILSGAGGAAGAETALAETLTTSIFARLDADQDGSITKAEMAASKMAQFARADRDRDGVVDATEMAAIRNRMARLAATAGTAMDAGLARMDKDGDGALSLNEFATGTPIFVFMDGDGDGAVTRAEFDRLRTVFAN